MDSSEEFFCYLNFTQAGLIFAPKEHEIETDGPIEVIVLDHIVFPLIIISVFHMITFVIFICQLGHTWCKYTLFI